MGECHRLSFCSFSLFFPLLLSQGRRLLAMWVCGTWQRDQKHCIAFIAFIPSVSCLLYYAFFVFYDFVKNICNHPIWCEIWSKLRFGDFFEDRVFFFSWSLGWLLCSFLDASMSSVVASCTPLNMKPTNQYFLRWNILITGIMVYVK